MINKHLIFILCLGFTSLYSIKSSAVEPELFDTWALNCQESCYIYQGMQSKNQNVIFSIQVSTISDDNTVMQLNFPLGLYIPAGIGVSVGDFKTNISLTTCLPKGCRALLVINDEIKKQLQTNDMLDVRFFSAQSEEKEISYSLKGFQSAFNAMSQR